MEAEPDVQVLINTSLTYFSGRTPEPVQDSDFQSLAHLEFTEASNTSDAVYERLKAVLKDGDVLERLEKQSEAGLEVDQEFRYSDLSFITMNFQPTLLIDCQDQLEAALRFLHLRKKFGSFLVEFGRRTDPGTALIQKNSSSYLILVRKFTSKLNELPSQESDKQKSDCRLHSSIYSLRQLPAKIKLVMSIYNPLLVKDIRHIGYRCSSLTTWEKVADIFHDSYPFCYHMIDDVDYQVTRSVKIDMQEADLFDLAAKFNQRAGPLTVTWKDRSTISWDKPTTGQETHEQSAQTPDQSEQKTPIDGYRLPEMDYHKCIFEVCSFFGKLSMDFKAFDYDWSKPQGERVIKSDYLNKMQQKRTLDKKGIPYARLQKLVEDMGKEINSDFFSVELLLDSSLAEVFVVRCRRSADYRRFSGLHTVLEARLKSQSKPASNKTEPPN